MYQMQAELKSCPQFHTAALHGHKRNKHIWLNIQAPKFIGTPLRLWWILRYIAYALAHPSQMRMQ